MIWVDRMVKELKKRELPLEWVDDMKTPSGRIHVGALRGVVIHDLIYKALIDAGVEANFTYVFENQDPMDGMPAHLDAKKWERYMGMQLYKIPSPEPGYENFAEYHALEFQHVFEKINCHPTIIRPAELYNSGKMNGVIKEILDASEKVREIYLKVSKNKRPDDWHPFSIVCDNCSKIGTTYVYKWDGENVYYRCMPDMVKWAKGGGHTGKKSPFDGNGKLPWKLEWPAKWKVIGITVEGAGKDHMSAGGSFDIAAEVCRKILRYPVPHSFSYEWFTIGGKKMSSSKGVGTSAIEVSKILPPELLRFLIVRTPMETHLDFNPYGDTMLNLFDDYDRCLNAYFDKLENNIPEGKKGEVLSDFARIIELSEVRPLPEKRLFLPRFRTIVNLIKTSTDLLQFFENQKGSTLNSEEKEQLEEREVYARVYLDKYADKEDTIEFIEKMPDNIMLNDKERLFLEELSKQLSNLKIAPTDQKDQIQTIIFDILKKNNLSPRNVFKSFYQITIGRDGGPRAADLILEFGINRVKERINEVLSLRHSGEKQSDDSRIIKKIDPGQARMTFAAINSNIFSIDKAVSEKYPSIVIGVAIIKGVTIKKSDPELTKELDRFISLQKKLNNEAIGAYPEVLSYRKLYKEMGIDWHSRRPSPEALLRRLAQGKELYKINTCVDAYNLTVMKHRVSIGAFDYDKVSFPTVLKFPTRGDEILLLGDKEPTKYKSSELAYFDQNGGYNIDFNYRDAQRTAVSESTANILLNIDAIYDITRDQVEQSLCESIENIQKYCGGTVEIVGIAEGK